MILTIAPGEVDARRSSRSTRREAKRIFRQAELQYSLGQFARARDGYVKAYSVLPLPGFLFNIGQCHRMLRDYPKAIFFFKRYLSVAPGSRASNLVRSVLKRIEALVAAQNKQQALKQRFGVSARENAEAARRLLLEQRKLLATERQLLRQERAQMQAKLRAMLAAQSQPRVKRTPVYKKWWFWTIIAGSAAAVVGATLGATLGVRTKTVDPYGSLGTLYGL